MTVRQPRYNHDEFARRGDEIYQTQIRPQVEAGNHGKIVAIDIETLNLPWTVVDRGTLGDGSEAVFEVYAAGMVSTGTFL
ncbi:MAG: hypothetical protein AAF892_09720 [Cyanobacteria bacterium P01_D01_bin.71]